MQRILASLAFVAFLSSPGSSTVVEANGFPAMTDCGEGLVEMDAYHTGILNLVSIEDAGKSWFLTGRLWKCGTFFPQEAAIFCSGESNTSLELFQTCSQHKTETCKMVEDGIHTRTIVTILRGPSDSSESACLGVPCSSSSSAPPFEELSSEVPPGHPKLGEVTLPEYLENAIALGEPFPFRLAKEEIPRFSLVAQFFRYVSWVMMERGHLLERALGDLQIEPESPAETFFRKIIDQSILILGHATVDRSLKGQAFMEHQYAALRQKAARLGVLYRTLLDGLEDAGISPEVVESFCERHIRPHMQTFSTRADNSRYLEALRAFEAQLEAR